MGASLRLPALGLLLTVGCSDVDGDGHDHDHEGEVITTVELTFASQSGGSPSGFTWSDAEANANPVVDVITLVDGEVYDVAVTFSNELEDPVEPITPEIADESEEHQIFFTGSAVQGLATGANASAVIDHAYADSDNDGLPIGLENTVSTLGTGSGELTVTLRHLPPEDGSAVKVQGLAERVASDGFGSIGGDNDVSITFDLEVQ